MSFLFIRSTIHLYKVLYSDRPCKSNTPVNVLIGAGILKEVFGISDDELIENLMLDIRYQYALHTTSFDEQPLSDKSMSRFRKRCYDYNNTAGIDLIHDTMTLLADKICKFMKIMPDIKRMDSLMKDYFAKQDEDAPASVMIADGAYSGEDNVVAAEEKNAKLITTDLTGKETDDIVSDFEISEDGKKVITCPAHYAPIKNSLDPKTKIIRATFNRDCCAGCPNRDKCRAKINKRVANVTVSTKAIARADIRKYMQTDEFKNYARIRNGVETIPSILRNIYDVDKMPRGKTRGRLFLGFKIGALNFKKTAHI